MRTGVGVLLLAAGVALATGATLHGRGPSATKVTTHVAHTTHAEPVVPLAAAYVKVATLAPASARSTLLTHGARESAPTLTDLVYTPTVYPVHDGFRDVFTAAATTDQHTAVAVIIRDRHHRIVRILTTSGGPGRLSVTWNGYRADGRMAPSGLYEWHAVWRGTTGGPTTSADRSVALSHRYLVTHKTRYTLAGSQFWRAGGSDRNCSRASTRGSYYARGVWLSNQCTTSVAAAFYRLHLPAAVSYSSLAVAVWGFTDEANSRVFHAFGVDGGTNSFAGGRFATLTSRAHRVWSFGATPAAGHVSADHSVMLALSVDGRPSGTRDLDIYRVLTAVTYRVLN